MKKNICALAFILILPVLFSCRGADKGSKEKKQENSSLVGGDTDDHGCKTSAGYLWSVIKNKCVRLFEDGTKLNPLELIKQQQLTWFLVMTITEQNCFCLVASLLSFLNAKRKVSHG